MSQKLIALVAWISVAILAYVTLMHVGFVYSIYFRLAPFLRVDMKTYVHLEHVIAFAILGAIFAFAYPKRIYLVCSVVFLSAIVLEYLQTFTPDRHGTMIDAFEKIVGGAVGIFTAHAILSYARRSDKFQN